MEELVKALGRSSAVRDADRPARHRPLAPRRVAVIMIDGAIADGGPRGLPAVGQGGLVRSDRRGAGGRARDPSVRAVVLRVNSPGGSAFASDRIAREVNRLREAGKPVIVSMGDAAASGGYYVAAPADTILASPRR